MKIVSVEPRDVHLTIDLSLRQADMLLEFLNRCEVSFSKDAEPGFARAADYAVEGFFKPLNKVVEDLKNGA